MMQMHNYIVEIMCITAFFVIHKMVSLAPETASAVSAVMSQLQPFLQRAGRSTKLVAAHGVSHHYPWHWSVRTIFQHRKSGH